MAHRKRAAIEPVGDNTNIMLAAAAFNFKRMMNKWKASFFVLFQNLIFQFRNWILNWKISLEMSF